MKRNAEMEGEREETSDLFNPALILLQPFVPGDYTSRIDTLDRTSDIGHIVGQPARGT